MQSLTVQGNMRSTVNFFCSLIVLCSSHFHGFAQNPRLGNPQSLKNDTFVNERIKTGIQAMYSMKYAEAARDFDDLISKYPDEPIGYFFRAQIHLWKYLFNYSDPDFKQFLIVCDKAINAAEASLRNRPNDTFTQTTIGAVYGFRAMANFRAENFVKAALDGRSCYNYLSEVEKKNPQEYDAYLGLGMFHFGIAAMPSVVRTLANFAGLKGSLEGGLAEIRMASEKSVWAKNDAALFLAMINVYYKRDFTQGLKYLNDLRNRFPNNVPVLYSLGNVELFLRKPEAAIPHYKAALAYSDTNFKAFSAFSQYRLGECYWRLNDYNEAKRYFQSFLKGKFERSFRGNALLRLALCYEMTGSRSDAVKGYEKCAQMTAFEPDDRFAIRRSKLYAQKPLEAAQIQLIQGINHVESLRFQEAEKLLVPLIENKRLSKEIIAEAAYNLGESMREQKRYAEAQQSYNRAIQAEPEQERWILPWSYYRLAEIFYAQQKFELSRLQIEKARVFRGFDFEEWLTFLIERDATMLKG